MVVIENEDNSAYLFVLEKEELLFKSLYDVIPKTKLQGGIISGVGALKNIELGYYHLEGQTYQKKIFDKEDYELLSLSGNLTLKSPGEPFIHLHAVLGQSDFSCFGGHLFEATVAVTTEIWIYNPKKYALREMNAQIGLSLIKCGVNAL